MSATTTAIELEATIVRDKQKGGWTYVLLPGSKAVLGTGNPVRVEGSVDSVPIEATLLPFGGGTHMLPLKQAVMRAVGKDDGDLVVVRIAPRERSGR
ncbi:DUF1905 domain-containing protein [Agrococcus sp. ARC_14]|uniref:DUF1905 domain-containing protein n=1 Tax=Agrococcus sp. ARC_14 TaxID=2919927 RepID=UPI001F058946|nr:DUF1905 domain-containing protein [Agrococcus sp. ARC_14]MCH1881654.1 DUF1905 domain-containing protein [Agrococcus sp. ARC_14]